MLKELVETIAAQGRRGDAVMVTEIKGRPREVLLSQNGEREIVKLDPPLRAVKVSALSSLAAYLKPHAERAQVFLSQAAAIALLDGDDRRETCTLPLTHTAAWRLVSQWAEWRAFQPDVIVRALRGLDVPTGFLSSISKIDFKRQSGVQSETAHGRETLGRSVEAQVQGADKIPDFFDLELPVFIEDGCRRRVTIRVEVYLNVKEATVDLRVLPDRLAMGVAEVLEDIADGIEAHEELKGVRVFMGSP